MSGRAESTTRSRSTSAALLEAPMHQEPTGGCNPTEPIDAATRLPDPGALPDELTIGADLSAYLRTALKTLSEDQRTAVVFRFYLDYTIPEIAETTGWAEGTVKSRLSRATTALRGNINRDAMLVSAPVREYQS